MLEKLKIKIFNYYMNLLVSNRILKNIDIEITNRCNLFCKHCYMNATNSQKEETIKTEEWKIFIDNIYNKFWNKITLSFTWWEALVRKDIFEILNYAKNLGFKMTLVTNWTLLNKEKITKLWNLLSTIAISIDWLEKEHNNLRWWEVFNLTIENIKLIKKYSNLPIVIKTVIWKNNYVNIDLIYELIKEINPCVWNLFPIEPIWRWAELKKNTLTKKEYIDLCDFIDKIKKENKWPKIIFSEQNSNFLKTKDYYKIRKNMWWIEYFTVLSNWNIVKHLEENRDIVYWNIKTDNILDVWNINIKNSLNDNSIREPYYINL